MCLVHYGFMLCQEAISKTIPRLHLWCNTAQGLYSMHNMDKGSLFWEKAGKEGVRINLVLRTETTNLPLYFSLFCITWAYLYATQECKIHLLANVWKDSRDKWVTTRGINIVLFLIIDLSYNEYFPSRQASAWWRMVGVCYSLILFIYHLPNIIFFYFSMLPVFLLNPCQLLSKPSSFILPSLPIWCSSSLGTFLQLRFRLESKLLHCLINAEPWRKLMPKRMVIHSRSRRERDFFQFIGKQKQFYIRKLYKS